MIDPASLRCVALSPGAGAEAAVIEAIERALARGATAIWLRERERDPESRRRLAIRAREATRRAGTALWIAGDVALAAEIGADAVHLGFRDPTPAVVRARCIPDLAIGYSAHDPLDRAAIEASDHVTLSPFAATGKGHPSPPPLGAERFAALRALVPRPVVALGGIDETNAALAIRAGADGVAVLRACERLDSVLAALRSAPPRPRS